MRLLSIMILLMGLTGSAFAETERSNCISANSVRSFTAVDRHTIRIRSFRKSYLLTGRACPDLRYVDRIGFESFSSSFVCRGDKLLTADISGRITGRCLIGSIQEEQPAE